MAGAPHPATARRRLVGQPPDPPNANRRVRYERAVSRTAKLLTVAWIGGIAAWTFAVVDPGFDAGHALAFAGGMFIASGSIPLILLSEIPRSRLTRPLLFESTYRTCVPLFFGSFLVPLLPDMATLRFVVAALALAVGAVVVATSFPPVLLRRVRQRGGDTDHDHRPNAYPIRPK